MNYKRLLLVVLLGASVSGCITTKQNSEATTNTDTPEIITEDIEVIAKNDTTGRVDAAKEVAVKLIADAKAEAARIKKEADDIMAVKTREAEQKAEEMTASLSEQLKKDKAEAAKQYLLERKAELQDETEKLMESAKQKASELKAYALDYANKLKEKGSNESEKIANQVIESARKSAADLTKKADKQAAKIKKEASKLFESAKEYTDKQKKEADEYVKKTMTEADKAVAKIKSKLKQDTDEGAKPALANTILDKILDGMKDGDYNDFTSKFTKDLKGNFTEKRFEALNTQLKGKIGDFKSRIYLGSLQKGPLTVYLWKAKFTNAKNNDLVIRLTLGELDEKDQVFAFDISNL